MKRIIAAIVAVVFMLSVASAFAGPRRAVPDHAKQRIAEALNRISDRAGGTPREERINKVIERIRDRLEIEPEPEPEPPPPPPGGPTPE